MPDQNQKPDITLEVAKSVTGKALEDNGVPTEQAAAMISTFNQKGFTESDDVKATRQVVAPDQIPIEYKYNEKQMFANMTAAISSDVEDMKESELLQDETFGYASRRMYRSLMGADFTGTDEEATQYGIDLMRKVDNNLAELGNFSNEISNMSQDDAKVALYMMDMFEAKDFTMRGFAEAMGYMGYDPSTYIGIGSLGWGFAGRAAAKEAAKKTMVESLKNIALKPAVAGAIEGGVYTGAFEHERQQISAEAGEGYDSGSVGLNTLMGTAFGAAAGKYLPEIFDYAAEKVAKWSAEGNFKRNVVAAAARGDEDAKRVLKDMAMLDKSSYVSRRLDEFERTPMGKMLLGRQTIMPEEPVPERSIDETLQLLRGLPLAQRKRELTAMMRDIPPEEKGKVIAELKSLGKPKKAEAPKIAKRAIEHQEKFNAHFYSKLGHELDGLPPEKEYTPEEMIKVLTDAGVKKDEIEVTGIDQYMVEGEKYTSMDLVNLLDRMGRKDEITKRTYDAESSLQPEDFDTWESDWFSETESSRVSIGDSGVGWRLTDGYSGNEAEIGLSYDYDTYVDDSGYEYDYAEMLDDWLDNYGDDYLENAKNDIAEENEIDPDEAMELYEDEIRERAKENGMDDGNPYDYYFNKEVYVTDRGDTFDDLDDAKRDVTEQLYDEYTEMIEETDPEDQFYAEYTVDGGDDYRLEVYQMEEFTSRKLLHQEPHFGSLEYGGENVQVHARMKNREDSEGNVGTVLEEVQSQWEQDWRAQGGGKKLPSKEEMDAARKQADDLNKENFKIIKSIKINEQELKDLDKQRESILSQKLEDISSAERVELKAIQERMDLLTQENRNAEARQNEIGRKHRGLEEIYKPKEPKLPTPPLKKRTQYTKLAMLDNLLNSLEDGQDYFGWINGHIQNGSAIETTVGMSQAYDIEMPRIIQKATGETPYMAKFYDGMPISGEKIYWDAKKANNLEYYKDISDKENNGEKWYWRIDYTPELREKLKDAKIELYGVGGVSLITADQISEEDKNANSTEQ